MIHRCGIDGCQMLAMRGRLKCRVHLLKERERIRKARAEAIGKVD